MATMTLERIADLRVAEWNPRIIMRDEYRQLVGMIRTDPEFLEARPVLATDDGTIYGGAQRFRAVSDLYRTGWRSPWGAGLVPAIRSPISASLAHARAIRDNTHAGDWQEIDLASVLTEIAAEAGANALPTLGLRDADLANALAAAGIGEPVDPLSGRVRRWDAPQRLPVRPGGLGTGPVGSGATSGDDEPQRALTVVLRFGTEAGRAGACDRLMAGEGTTTLPGLVELTSYDAGGRLVLCARG